MGFILIRAKIMLFNFFKCKNTKIEKEDSKPYLTQELMWDDEKIIATQRNGIQKIMYYKDIIRVDIIFYDFYLPVPKWTIQDDNVEDHPSIIEFYNDLQPNLTDLLVDIFSKKLAGYDNEKVHQTIIEAMGATIGFFHVWGREDLDQALAKINKYNQPKWDAEFDKFMKEVELKKANKWWKKLFK